MASSVAAAASTFLGTRLVDPAPQNGRIVALLGFGGKKAAAKKKAVKKAARTSTSDRPLWYPGAVAPDYLDGSLVGDYGFDPFGLGKPAEYLQFELDSLDQNLAKNVSGDIIGTRFEPGEVKSTPFQPYTEVFGLQRFRECELIHGRWAMLATLGALSVEWLTGVTWQDAGKVELEAGSSYLGQPLPFSISTLILIEVLLIGYIEFQRNAELDPEQRLYPGGSYFDPLGLASDPEKKERLQLAEIKHARLAMVGFLGFAVQAAATGKGPLNNWATHLSAGIVGTAPSVELLNIWNERERKLAETSPESLKLCEVLHQRPLANLPTPENCLLGQIQEGTTEWQKIANEAARTIPGRENGGNCDIKNLSRGSKVYLPVFVDGANLSTGDMHFSQGDGEVSFCGAIEMSGFLELKCEIIRGGMKEYLTPVGPTALHVNPIFEIGPVEPRFSEWLVFEGISVDESGKQHFLDASVAYKRAVLNAIEYLSKFGYSKEQVYLLLSCCPCEGRISGIVDSPNAVATLAIPTAIFDQDIKPKRLRQGPKLRRLPDVLRCTYDGRLPVTQDQTGTRAP